MARIKGATMTHKRRKKMLKLAKGFYGCKSKHFKMAKQQVMKSGNYALAGRRMKKRQFRNLWICRNNNGTIPGYRPGKPTSDFITKVLGKITFIGALFLGVVAVMPIVLGNVTGENISLGGTSLLIVVGVALDTSRSLESYMLMRHHKGFLE